jgi:hypothetical protein
MKFGTMARQATTRIICALLLILAGFAHRPVSVVAAPLQLSVELPDGTVPDLCLSPFGAQKNGDQNGDHGCDACRLAGGAMLPEPVSMAFAATNGAGDPLIAASQTYSSQFLYRGVSPPRAPPAMRV